MPLGHPKRSSAPVLRKQRGAVLIELVIVLVLFIFPIFMGVIEIGRLVYTYKTIVHQLHHSARYLSLQMPGVNQETAICLFKTGRPMSSCGVADALSPEFHEVNLTISYSEVSVGSVAYPNYANVVTFTASNFQYNFIFSKLFNIPSLTLGSINSSFRLVN